MPEDNSSTFTLLPPGTVVFEPFEAHVTLLFPDDNDAIAFYEFLRAFVNGEIELEARDVNG